MKILNRNSDYALQALCHIAAKNETAPVSGLSKDLNIPRPFLRKILQTLTSAGILTSTKGSGGGFNLSRPPDKISLLDVINTFQDPVRISDCSKSTNPACGHTSCNVRQALEPLERSITSQLDTITLSCLI